MDWLDDTLTAHFSATTAPAGLADRALRAARAPVADLSALVDRLRIDATARGIARLELLPRSTRTQLGTDTFTSAKSGAAHAHAEQARRELAEYVTGRRTFFSVPIDLADVPAFQEDVLAHARAIPFGEVISYAELARRIGRPRAARAVGNALGANPVPLVIPCHRIIRGDGSWGHYALGAAIKTELLALERRIPALVGCTTTHIVCRRGCSHEQRMREDRRVVFASVLDARSVGYRPCRVCRPIDPVVGSGA